MKQIEVIGHTLGDGRFQLAFAKHNDNGQGAMKLGDTDDWNTVIQTLRLRNLNPIDSRHRGFTYTFPIIFGN